MIGDCFSAQVAGAGNIDPAVNGRSAGRDGDLDVDRRTGVVGCNVLGFDLRERVTGGPPLFDQPVERSDDDFGFGRCACHQSIMARLGGRADAGRCRLADHNVAERELRTRRHEDRYGDGRIVGQLDFFGPQIVKRAPGNADIDRTGIARFCIECGHQPVDIAAGAGGKCEDVGGAAFRLRHKEGGFRKRRLQRLFGIEHLDRHGISQPLDLAGGLVAENRNAKKLHGFRRERRQQGQGHDRPRHRGVSRVP